MAKGSKNCENKFQSQSMSRYLNFYTEIYIWRYGLFIVKQQSLESSSDRTPEKNPGAYWNQNVFRDPPSSSPSVLFYPFAAPLFISSSILQRRLYLAIAIRFFLAPRIMDTWEDDSPRLAFLKHPDAVRFLWSIGGSRRRRRSGKLFSDCYQIIFTGHYHFILVIWRVISEFWRRKRWRS